MKIKIEDIDYHRNGISGVGFHVVTFRWAEDKDEPRPMVAVLFPDEGCCAVLDRQQPRDGNIAFAGGNSWRGDHFEDILRREIKKWQALPWFEQEAIRAKRDAARDST